MNLFISTRRLTEAKEDHLTEFLASALEVDEAFRQAYASTVLHSYCTLKGWSPVEIKAISTQKTYPDAGCRPDLVLTLADDHVIACEHKLEAPETLGEPPLAEEEGAPVRQLERYLELPGVHGVAYFRSSLRAPDAAVLNHPRYVRPSSGREHFLWSDLYESLLKGSGLVTCWLREGFGSLGFTPPHPFIGDLNDPDEAIRVRNRENLKKLWNLARTRLHRMGWKVEAGSICQLYLKNNARSNAEMILVSPYESGGRILLVRITLRDPKKANEIATLLQSRDARMAMPLQIELVDVPRAAGTRTVVDVKIPFNKLLDGATVVQEIEKILSDYVCTIAERVQR